MQNHLYYRDREIEMDGPICGLPRDIIWPLCAHLSNESAIAVEGRGGDWRDLADHIGFPSIAIDYIRDSKDKTKAYTLCKVWDRGVTKNQGSIRKLIIALYGAGFEAYLNDYLLKPLAVLEKVGSPSVETYVATLRGEIERPGCPLFPCLDLNDIVLDEEMDEHTLHLTRSQSPETTDEWSCPGVHESNIYISYYMKSRSKTYTREVKNLACLFESYGYQVLYETTRSLKSSDIRAQKEKWIRSSANIIVVFNKEYQRAIEAHINGERLPTCLEIDIPLITHIFHTGGRSRIIPVVIDQCRTQPPLESFPVWLTGTPRRLFPRDTRVLLASIQNVPVRVVHSTPKVRTFRPAVVNGDDIRRRFFESKR